jgi:hypothetical protein
LVEQKIQTICSVEFLLHDGKRDAWTARQLSGQQHGGFD